MQVTESRNGGVYIIDGEVRHQLSEMQLVILSLTYRSVVKHTPRSTKATRARIDRFNKRKGRNLSYPEPPPRGRPPTVRRIERTDLHKGVFDHDTQAPFVESSSGPLSPSNRAALSRSLKRLGSVGLIQSSRDSSTLTEQGRQLVRRLMKMDVIEGG